ncbi:MAG: dephospho-CoA kinase [Kiritimatiellae bacterium]|nr:dephospho-CoA kinase [Kiritimatiellia bacterium]
MPCPPAIAPQPKNRNPRLALTGGIACGKSLLSHYLNELGVETIDADGIVHELIPDPAERRRIAAEVFADPAKRKELEARLHPLVKERIEAFVSGGSGIRIAIIPLLFETHWDAEYDIICCVVSERETQISRMVATRGYTREEAEARLAAQLPVAEKAAKSHYVIENNGTAAELRSKAEEFVKWLKNSMCSPAR